MSLRCLSWFAAILAIFHLAPVSSLAIRQSSGAQEIQRLLENCSTDIVLPILQFITTNYIAHAFTVRFSPGYGVRYSLLHFLLTLAFPYFGLLMACHTLEQLPIFTGDPLDCALKAGALCTIARTEKWRPERGDKIWLINGTSEDQTTASLDASPQDHSKNLSSGERTTTDGMVQVYCEEEGMESLPQSLMKVHGLCRLPRAHASAKCEVCSVNTVAPEAPTGLQHCQKGQYTLVRIPPHCTVNWKRRDDFHQEITTYHSKDGHRERLWAFIKKCFGKESPVKEKPRLADYDIGISAQLSVIKSMIALVQLYSTITILKDNKPKDYGAYQLTLLPYAIMTLVNILSGLFTPSYSSVYMVESTLMKEAENRGGVFEGTVGVLDECEPAILHTTDFEVREVAVSPADGDPHKGEHAVAETALSERGMTNSLPIIRYRHFSLTGGDLIRGYFFYLKRRMPILRLIRNNISHHQPSEGDILGSPASNNGTQNILPNPNHTHISESSESSFWHIFKKRNNPQPAANSNRYYFVFSIGNAKHRACDRRWLQPVMDVLILTAFALPFITIYMLTGFKAPDNRWHGVVFMLWLAVGEFPYPALALAYWSMVNSQFKGRVLMWAIRVGNCIALLAASSAVAGFYFVGDIKYHELSRANANCSIAQQAVASMLNQNTSAGYANQSLFN